MLNLRNIIVIGASAGGFNTIGEVLGGFPPDIDAAVLVVIHISRKSDSRIIAATFQRSTTLKCVVAAEGMPLKRGHVYVAPPDHHIMVEDSTIHVNQGPHENKYRPSIDVLFRSAAVSFGHRAIGVILSGLLDDGTSGMWAIKSSGGICIVQSPEEARFPDMPRSVMNKIEVDHIAIVDNIPAVITSILNEPLPPEKPVPAELQIEADITYKMMTKIDQLKKIAVHSDYNCPECGGGLWEIKHDPTHRYRCHTGHVYTEALLNELKDEKIEESVWVSIRMLEEKANLLKLMVKRGEEEPEIASARGRRVDEINKHISRLKSLLLKLNEHQDPPGYLAAGE
jgi:two-component system chemotaxis response regulator CheB